jgi:hypothetical protein
MYRTGTIRGVESWVVFALAGKGFGYWIKIGVFFILWKLNIYAQ